MKYVSGIIKLIVNDEIISEKNYSSKKQRDEILESWNKIYGLKNKYYTLEIYPRVKYLKNKV